MARLCGSAVRSARVWREMTWRVRQVGARPAWRVGPGRVDGPAWRERGALGKGVTPWVMRRMGLGAESLLVDSGPHVTEHQ
jgi:hypothetical protein